MKAKSVFENMDFKRGQDPKEAMGLGTVIVAGDRGYGRYRVHLIERFYASNLESWEEAWKARMIGPADETSHATEGAIVYVIKGSEQKDVWGEIDPFIASGE